MAITITTLTAAMTAGTDSMNVTAATGAVANMPVRIGNEYAVVSSISGLVIFLKWRGDRGTIAEAHGVKCPVSFYATNADLDSPDQRMHDVAPAVAVTTYNVTGALEVPVVDTIAYIVKTTAAAVMTLANPGKDSVVEYHIISGTAQAHTVTYTAGFNNNTTSSDVATFAAKDGANLWLRAFNGKWVAMNIVDRAATAMVAIG